MPASGILNLYMIYFDIKDCGGVNSKSKKIIRELNFTIYIYLNSIFTIMYISIKDISDVFLKTKFETYEKIYEIYMITNNITH